MLRFLKNFFTADRQAPQAPYKVEAPAPAVCGCGRSASGLCVGLHRLTEQEWAQHPDNAAAAVTQQAHQEVAVAAAVDQVTEAIKKKPAARQSAAKKPAVTKLADKKPAVIKAPAKPRKSTK